jgi:hypothetical protein
MLSKVVSISLLVIANLVILAHDVIPHHHHDDYVCFEHGSCAAHHANDSEHGKLPGSEDEACCILDNLLIIPANSRYDKIISSSSIILPDSGNHGFALLANAQFDFTKLLLPLLFRQHSQKLNFYHAFTSLSAGLRAPPVI